MTLHRQDFHCYKTFLLTVKVVRSAPRRRRLKCTFIKKSLSIFVCRLCLYPVAWLVHIWLEVLFIPTTRLVLIQQKLCLHLQVCSHPVEGFVYILRNIRSHPAGYFYMNLNTSSHTLPGLPSNRRKKLLSPFLAVNTENKSVLHTR